MDLQQHVRSKRLKLFDRSRTDQLSASAGVTSDGTAAHQNSNFQNSFRSAASSPPPPHLPSLLLPIHVPSYTDDFPNTFTANNRKAQTQWEAAPGYNTRHHAGGVMAEPPAGFKHWQPYCHLNQETNHESALKHEQNYPLNQPNEQSGTSNSDGMANAVTNFAHSIVNHSCLACGAAPLPFPKQDLVFFFKRMFIDYRRGNIIRFMLMCNTCAQQACPGCGVPISSKPLEYGAADDNGKHFTWHCDRGRLALIWLLLCAYDDQARHNKPHSSQPSTSRKRSGSSKSHPAKQARFGAAGPKNPLPKGVGYASEYGMDDVYATNFTGSGQTVGGQTVGANTTSGHRRSHKSATPEHTVDPDDALTAEVMVALSALLPSTYDIVPTNFDMNPPHELAAVLLRSSILDKTAELLRNDSLEDAINRSKLYDSLLLFVRRLAGAGKIVAEILHTERTINKGGHNLLSLSYEKATHGKDKQESTATPLASAMQNLTSQGETMLKHARNNADAFEMDEGQNLLLLCTNIVGCNEEVKASDPCRSSKAKEKVASDEDPDAWQKELACLDVPDQDILAIHYSAKAAEAIKNPPTGRMRVLHKEIVSLRTSLPPGIFVRYGENRIDVMKVIIVGPKGTPYENGLFEFDLFCPANYPNDPPQMHIKTTGGGKHRFNPNLYADGKVCLSLLNTWSTPDWTPGKSTILQVLVSVQAMIFCDEPHCNEPNFEHENGTETSMAYNRGQYASVVKYAMLEWLDGERRVTPSIQSARAQAAAAKKEAKEAKEAALNAWQATGTKGTPPGGLSSSPLSSVSSLDGWPETEAKLLAVAQAGSTQSQFAASVKAHKKAMQSIQAEQAKKTNKLKTPGPEPSYFPNSQTANNPKPSSGTSGSYGSFQKSHPANSPTGGHGHIWQSSYSYNGYTRADSPPPLHPMHPLPVGYSAGPGYWPPHGELQQPAGGQGHGPITGQPIGHAKFFGPGPPQPSNVHGQGLPTGQPFTPAYPSSGHGQNLTTGQTIGHGGMFNTPSTPMPYNQYMAPYPSYPPAYPPSFQHPSAPWNLQVPPGTSPPPNQYIPAHPYYSTGAYIPLPLPTSTSVVHLKKGVKGMIPSQPDHPTANPTAAPPKAPTQFSMVPPPPSLHSPSPPIILAPMAKSSGPVDRSAMWKDVVTKHFATREEEILKKVCQWTEERLNEGERGGRRLGGKKVVSVEEVKAKGKGLREWLAYCAGQMGRDRYMGY